MTSRVKRGFGVGAGIVLVSVAFWWWQRGPVVSVEVGIVTEGPLRVTINERGTTRVRAHADLNAPVSGRWVPSALQVGDVLPSGARVGLLYPAPMDGSARRQAEARLGSADALLTEAQSRIAAARSALGDAERSRVRTEGLAAAGGVSPQELERARDAVTGARSAFEAAQARVLAARYERDQARSAAQAAGGSGAALPIVTPIPGTVLQLDEEHERVVPAGTRLLEVGDPSDLEVVIPVRTADAVRMREGAGVRLSFGPVGATDGDRASGTAVVSDTIAGVVRRIEPAAFTRLSSLGVEEQRVNVIATVPATAVHVGDRFEAQARITVWETNRAVRVPVSALVRDGEQWLVWRLQAGRVRRRTVTLGERSDTMAQVLGGLAAGDTVVVYPGDAITEGARVKGTVR
ncbi:MAG: efflux RND transporter periplasmic adaptor subunit [Gemmatimonas sp.]|jgi:HlyD family secretion protein|uniref:efflux RND transporter periplasmic adaptor subunit n=1 Tax=Gemmatimonas sp. TaxID=1962908 RepID=UPI00391F0940|nr:HlyD family efflux transporter periplasmic adaptor subunit [Gemmatimonadota bacterium]